MCKKPIIGTWYRVEIKPMAMHDVQNVSHMIVNGGEKDFCEKCFGRLKEMAEKEVRE